LPRSAPTGATSPPTDIWRAWAGLCPGHHESAGLWLVERLPGHDPFGLRPRLAPALLADWSREKIHREVLDPQALGRERGFSVVVVLMPAKEHIDPRSPSLYGDLSQRLGAEVPLLDGLAALRRVEPDVGALFFRYDIHLTADGNRLLGEAVAAFLVERGLVGRAALPVARRDAPVERDHGAGDVRTRP
jgi:hypothetical protein